MALAAGNILTVDFGTATPAAASSFISLVKTYDERKWYLFLLKWVDASDIVVNENTGDVELAASAYDLLRDMLNNRPTELGVFLVLVAEAMGRFRREQRALTERQQRAVDLAEEAAGRGENAARYVSAAMGIHVSNAYRLLQRGNARAKSANFVANPYKVSNGRYHPPTEREIQRRMAHLRHKCPGSGWNVECEGHAYGDRGLCWPCFNRYGFEGERPGWLAYLISENRKQARQYALDSLCIVQIGDDEEFDALLAAA